MLRRAGGLAVVVVAGFALSFVGAPSIARAQAVPGAGGFTVALTPDQPVVTVDRDAPSDQVVRYEVVVRNGGADVVPGVVVDVALHGGPPVRREIGDVPPGGASRTVVEATLVAATASGRPLESTATARSSDGRSASSGPARVDVQVISSTVIEPDDPPASTVIPAPTVVPATAPATVVRTEVEGVTYQRPAGPQLARTGPGPGLAVLVAAGAALVLCGMVLVRRTADDG